MADSISNSDDIIDSRQVIERLDELQEERDDLLSEVSEALAEFEEAAERDFGSMSEEEIEADPKLVELASTIHIHREALREWDVDNWEELKALISLQEDCEGYCEDWRHGATLIRDSYFETYARDFAEDIGAIKSDLGWPYDCIDWERAARELRMDYTSVEFDDVTYWVR